MSRKSIIISLVLLFLVAPGCGYVGSMVMTKKHEKALFEPAKERTIAELQTALDTANNESGDNKIVAPHILSFKRYNNVWYLATVSVNNSGKADSLSLIGDLNGTKGPLVVILAPSETFPYTNISNGMGVPYELINDINTFYKDDTSRNDEPIKNSDGEY